MDFSEPSAVLGGLDLGAHEINIHRNVSVNFNGGIEGPLKIYLGGQFAYNREWLLPPFWDGKPDPIESGFELSGQLGKIFAFQNMYLRACMGFGFTHAVRRGEYIPDSDNKYEPVNSNGFGLPIELSAGYLKKYGIGLKWKTWIGRNTYSGLMIEFLGRGEKSVE